MDDEALILFVQEYKELYDSSDSNYMNNVRRMNAWEEIATNMNGSGKQHTVTLNVQFKRRIYL